MSEPTDRTTGPAWWLLVGLTFVVTSESIRVVFPLLYDVREDAGASSAIVWALGAFALVPALTPVLRRIAGPGTALRLAVIALAAARMAMQLVDPVPLWMAATAVAAGLVALTCELHASRARAEGAGAAIAITIALAVDSAIRGAYETWDPVWQDGTAPTVVAAVLAGTLVGAAFAASLRPALRDAESRRPWTLALVGPCLLLQTLFLQNAATLASESGDPLPLAIVFVLTGGTLAVAAVATAARRPDLLAPPAARATVVVAFVAVVAGLSLTDVRGLVPMGQVLASVLLLWAIDRPAAGDGPSSSVRTSLAFALGMALFVGGAFAYQIDIDVPLPMPRATWPIAAAVLVSLSAAPRPNPTPSLVPPRLWLVPAGLLALVALTLGMRGTGSDPMPPVPYRELRVMSWNIHTAVNGDGNVDLATIAHEIERHDPPVVLLQEVGRGWPIAGQVDQAEWLARRLDMALSWVSAADDQFGNAILTDLPVLRTEILRLPYGEGPQHRSALRIQVDTLAGWHPWIVDVHLQNGEKETTREDQIVALRDAWSADVPTVIGGDLNMEPTEDNVTLFEEAGLVSAQDAVGDPQGSTAREPEFPGNRVDWIWVSADLTPSDFTIARNDASDHLPLVVTVTPADEG